MEGTRSMGHLELFPLCYA